MAGEPVMTILPPNQGETEATAVAPVNMTISGNTPFSASAPSLVSGCASAILVVVIAACTDLANPRLDPAATQHAGQWFVLFQRREMDQLSQPVPPPSLAMSHPQLRRCARSVSHPWHDAGAFACVVLTGQCDVLAGATGAAGVPIAEAGLKGL